jgi:aerobic carbon-monoxide dehydrogenase small subunit
VTSSTPFSVTLVVNGRSVTREAGGHLTLLRWLRENADALDPKYACGEGICGAVSSCVVLAAQVDGAEVTTAAGLTGPDGSLNDLQESFHRHHAAQCGFCTPGMLICAAAMLSEGAAGSREEIREGLHGNLCRCTGYQHIVDAIEECATTGTSATTR